MKSAWCTCILQLQSSVGRRRRRADCAGVVVKTGRRSTVIYSHVKLLKKSLNGSDAFLKARGGIRDAGSRARGKTRGMWQSAGPARGLRNTNSRVKDWTGQQRWIKRHRGVFKKYKLMQLLQFGCWMCIVPFIRDRKVLSPQYESRVLKLTRLNMLEPMSAPWCIFRVRSFVSTDGLKGIHLFPAGFNDFPILTQLFLRFLFRSTLVSFLFPFQHTWTLHTFTHKHVLMEPRINPKTCEGPKKQNIWHLKVTWVALNLPSVSFGCFKVIKTDSSLWLCWAVDSYLLWVVDEEEINISMKSPKAIFPSFAPHKLSMLPQVTYKKWFKDVFEVDLRSKRIYTWDIYLTLCFCCSSSQTEAY